jgi:putative SOS response-associated peptidase YedK
MCGRVRLSSDVSEIKLVFSIPPHRLTPNFPPSWNVAPTDPLPAVRFGARAGERSLGVLSPIEMSTGADTGQTSSGRA